MDTRPLVLLLAGLLAGVAAQAGCALDAKGLGTSASQGQRDSAQLDDAGSDEDASPTDDGGVAADAKPDAALDTEPADVEPEAPPPTLPGCTHATYGGHDYLFCERPGNWDQARVSCQFAGMALVKIDDKPEHDFVLKLLGTKSKNQFHIGLWDTASEGDFVWLDGSKPSFTNWAALEPNDFFWREDCVCVEKSNGKWNDIECGASRDGFVCETP